MKVNKLYTFENEKLNHTNISCSKSMDDLDNEFKLLMIDIKNNYIESYFKTTFKQEENNNLVKGDLKKLKENEDLEEEADIISIYSIDHNFLIKLNNIYIDDNINFEEKNPDKISNENIQKIIKDTDKFNKNTIKTLEKEIKNILTNYDTNNTNIKKIKDNKFIHIESQKNQLVKDFEERLKFNESLTRINTVNKGKIINKNLLNTDNKDELTKYNFSSFKIKKHLNTNNNNDEKDRRHKLSNIPKSDIVGDNYIKYEDRIRKLGSENINKVEQEIIKKVRTISAKDKREIKVDLYPKKLGSLKIEITLEDETLKAKIIVANEVTKELFINSIDDLSKNLAKQNIELKEMFIDVDSGFNNSSGNENREKRKNLKKELDNISETIEQLDNNFLNIWRYYDNINVLI